MISHECSTGANSSSRTADCAALWPQRSLGDNVPHAEIPRVPVLLPATIPTWEGPMRSRPFVPFIAAAGLLLASACEPSTTTAPLAPVAASRITNGTVDGAAHPAVVLIIMDVAGAPAYQIGRAHV